jgi:hypothetical protein
MSLAIRTERLISSEFTTSFEPYVSPQSTYEQHVEEAPDCGRFNREAPESHVGRQTEAPDAGEGRAGLLEHEFTHGRSQS